MAVLYRPLNASHLLSATRCAVAVKASIVILTQCPRLFVDRTCAGIQPLPPTPPSAIAGGRRVLRIGYITADFKDHPVAKRMQQATNRGFISAAKEYVTCSSHTENL